MNLIDNVTNLTIATVGQSQVTVGELLARLARLHGTTALTLVRATPYAIGGVAAFWTIDRVSSFL